MLDPKFIRSNTDVVREALKKRQSAFNLTAFLELDEARLARLRKVEDLSAVQNKANSEMQKLIKEKKNPKAKIAECKKVKKQIDELKTGLKNLDTEWTEQIKWVPNMLHSSVPSGGEKQNKVIMAEGKQRQFDYKPLTHIELAERLDIIDFKRAAKISGSNFALYKGAGAKLQRALINFMLDLHTKEHGYTEVFPPFLVNRAAMVTTGQLPKLEEDMYQLRDDDYFLIPTAEVPVTNIHRDEVLEASKLPLNYTAYTACFRREAGSYGKDTRGLVRVHQFDKVELVKFVEPQASYSELEKLLKDACRVLELLEIHYRVVLLAAQEVSFAGAKCYDIEVYAPGIDKWLEVASCSNFEDFQARRGNIQYKDTKTGKREFVHTLNGSGVALPRLVTAILENYQQNDGTVVIPLALRSYMGDSEKIS